MAKYDENFFKINGNENQIYEIKQILEEGEQLLWQGKPKKKAFVLNAFLKMMPFALIWLLFDGFFIATLLITRINLPTPAVIFLIVFFTFHLLPVWIWISNVLTANKQHKNLEYAFTNKRIIVKSGVIGIDFKNIYYSDINSVNLKVGLIDRMLKVGDIYINSTTGAAVLYDLDNPYFLTQRLQKIAHDIKTDIMFPNNLRPEENDGYNTKYKE